MQVHLTIAAAVAAAMGIGAIICVKPAVADDPDFLALSAGVFEIKGDHAAEFRLEYRSKLEWWIFRPFSGVMLTSDRALYGYGGILLDLYFGRRIVVTPSFAIGAFDRGHGKDLGHTVEFRSQIEVAYRFPDRSRLGISFNHLSNASISDKNPGAESLMLTYAIPFSRSLDR